RVRWLVIDKLATRKSDVALEDVNSVMFDGSKWEIFPRRRAVPSGRVDIERHGNAFEARTRGVSEFALLLTPEAIDFAKPGQGSVNGNQAFNGVVKKDLPTLLKWAARDNDRTALYGAELHIIVP